MNNNDIKKQIEEMNEYQPLSDEQIMYLAHVIAVFDGAITTGSPVSKYLGSNCSTKEIRAAGFSPKFWYDRAKLHYTPEKSICEKSAIDLNFHSSWDALIPIVKKFDRIYEQEPDLIETYHYTVYCDNIDEVVTQYEIEPAFFALGKAIEWYNSWKIDQAKQVIQNGADVSNFGDASSWQKDERQEREF